MKIRRKWWRCFDWWCLGRIVCLILILAMCFAWFLGIQRVNGEGDADLRDGDLVIYEKVGRDYGYDDAILVEQDGMRVVAFADLDGGIIKGRALAIIRTRGLVDE